jgi:hypothetical protein
LVGISDGAITVHAYPQLVLVADLEGPGRGRALEIAAQRREVIGNAIESGRRGGAAGEDGDGDRLLVHVHPDVDIGHGLVPPFLRQRFVAGGSGDFADTKELTHVSAGGQPSHNF